MKYTPKEDVEGINSTPDHPLKEFTILLFGSFAIIAVIVYFSGIILGEVAVQMAPKIENHFSKIEISPQTEEDTKLIAPDEKLTKLLHSIAPLESQKIKLSVLCEESPNAFAVPGGGIWITSSLIEKIKTEKGLAFVLAHELGHIENKDHIRALGQSLGFTLILGLIGMGESNSILYKIPTQMTYLGLSRNAEENADKFAINTLKKTYSSLRGSEEFFNVILEEDSWGSKIPAVLSTHPNTEKRRAQILELVKNESQEENKEHAVTHGCKKDPLKNN